MCCESNGTSFTWPVSCGALLQPSNDDDTVGISPVGPTGDKRKAGILRRGHQRSVGQALLKTLTEFLNPFYAFHHILV